MPDAPLLAERLAEAAVRLTARAVAERSGSPPRFDDFREAFLPLVRVALLRERLETLELAPEQAMQKKIDTVRDLLEIAKA